MKDFLRNTFLFLAGIIFLSLSKVKNILQHYTTPSEYDCSEVEECINNDLKTVDNWFGALNNYTQNNTFHLNKNILELGPGSDLGIGVYLLAKGCYQYNALNINDLLKFTPENFYKQFFTRLKKIDNKIDIEFLERQLANAKEGNPSKLNYKVRNDFNIVSAFGKSTIDIVLSYAAFEHFDDLDETVSQLNEVCKPGAIVIAEIDLKTHSRWIRKKDPNNIYRYSRNLYNLFWFRGIPNRIRPYQYKEAFERYEWTDISIIPLMTAIYNQNIYSGLNQDFINKKNQMEYLSIMFCARKKE
jgi:SAM-dependent methyltransferase